MAVTFAEALTVSSYVPPASPCLVLSMPGFCAVADAGFLSSELQEVPRSASSSALPSVVELVFTIILVGRWRARASAWCGHGARDRKKGSSRSVIALTPKIMGERRFV